MDPIFDVRPSALPMLRNGFVTFGVFNRIDKISDEVLAVWSKLLREVAGSKIVTSAMNPWRSSPRSCILMICAGSDVIFRTASSSVRTFSSRT